MQVNCYYRPSSISVSDNSSGSDGLRPLCSYLVSRPVTAHKIRSLFPLTTAHTHTHTHAHAHSDRDVLFRVRISGSSLGLSDNEHLWLDLPCDSQEGKEQESFSPALSLQDLLSLSVHRYEDKEAAAVDVLCVFRHADCDVLVLDDHHTINNNNNNDKSNSSSNHSSAEALYASSLSERLPSESARSQRAQISSINVNNNNNNSNNSQTNEERDDGTTSSSAATQAAVHLAKKGASSLWRAVLSTAEKLQSVSLNNTNNNNSSSSYYYGNDNNSDGGSAGDSLLLAMHRLSQCAQLLATPYDEQTHAPLLVRLYALQCRDAPPLENASVSASVSVSVESAHWRSAGWQSTHPKNDLRGSGVLSLQAMLFLCERHAQIAQDMLARNRTNSKAHYPFAVVGVNLTLLLADLLQLRNETFRNNPSAFQQMFSEEDCFFEIFSQCFVHVDWLWVSSGAVRDQFGKIIGEVKALLKDVLAQGPQSLAEFREISRRLGMKQLP